MTPLMYAAREGRVAVCEKLLEHGAEINKQDIRGWTVSYLLAIFPFQIKSAANLLMKDGESENFSVSVALPNSICELCSSRNIQADRWGGGEGLTKNLWRGWIFSGTTRVSCSSSMVPYTNKPTEKDGMLPFLGTQLLNCAP